MGHDFTSDDGDEPNRTRVLLTDGGSEAEQEASEESEEASEAGAESEATSETESESGSESETSSESESASESESESESTDESEDAQRQEEPEETEDEAPQAAEAEGEGDKSAEDEGKALQEESQEEGKVDDSETPEETPSEPAEIEADDEAVAEQTGDVGVEPQPDAGTDAERADEAESTPSLDGEGDTASIIEVRNQVIELSTDVIGRSLDGIVEVSRNDDNWRAVVEIIERRSVPDTQDILGQYEIELDESGEVIGYRRLEKYRRADTGPSQH